MIASWRPPVRIAGLVERHRKLLTLTAYLAIVAVGLSLRLTYARLAEHPGHADQSFYFAAARNLAEGRGFTVDYIWHYLAPPATITHPSNDYWPPLVPVVMSVFMRLGGTSMFVALLPGILASVALSPLVYYWSRISSPSPTAALGAAVLVLFEPNLVGASLDTDTSVYFVFLASVSLFAMTRGLDDPRFFLAAAAAAALGHEARLDGLFLLVTLVIVICTSPHDGRTRLASLVGALVVYGLVLAPWLLLNERTLGSPLPRGGMKMALVTDYEDRYSYAKTFTLAGYLHQGSRRILRAKLEAARWNLRTLWALGGILWIPAGIGILESLVRRERRPVLRRYAPALLFFALLVAFHTLMPFSFALLNSAFAVIPFLALVSTDTLRRALRSASLALLVIGLLTAHYYAQALSMARTTITLNNQIGEQLTPLARIVAGDPGRPRDREVVIMTRIPWEVSLTTGYRAVQIPNDDLSTILAVARRYRVGYLLLPAPRAALQGIYEGTVRDPRFQFVAAIPYSDPFLAFMDAYTHLKLFRLVLSD